MAMNREALREELMIQEVILASLQGETFDDAEEQREDARKEISRLKRALKALPRSSSGDEGTNQPLIPPLKYLSMPSQSVHCME